MILLGWLEPIQTSFLGETIRSSIWLYPFLEILHILGFAVLYGAVVTWDWRLLGANSQLNLKDLQQHLHPWMYGGFGLAFLSGIGLFIVEAEALAINWAFQLKLILMLLAMVNAAIYQGKLLNFFQQRSQRVNNDYVVKIIAIASMIFWSAVIVCGRLIAYV